MDRSGDSVWWIADWGEGQQPADGDDTDYYFASSSLASPPQHGWRVDNHCAGIQPPPIVIPCGGSQQQRMYQPAIQPSRSGAPLNVIRSLPESKYKKLVKSKTDDDTKEKNEQPATNDMCCICLSEFKEGDSIIRLPCLHIFHSDEISKWLMKNHRCPLCQTSVLRGFMPIEDSKANGH